MPGINYDNTTTRFNRVMALLTPLYVLVCAKANANDPLPQHHLPRIESDDPPSSSHLHRVEENRASLRESRSAPSHWERHDNPVSAHSATSFETLFKRAHLPFWDNQNDSTLHSQHDWVHKQTDEFDNPNLIDWQPSTKHSCSESQIWVGKVKDQPLSALRGVTRFKIKEHALLDHLLNVKAYPKWMDGIAHAHSLDDSDRHEARFMIISIKSWLTDPRFSILQSSMKRVNDNKVIISASSLTDHPLPNPFDSPDHPTMHRLEKADCRFTLEKVNEHEFEFTYDIKLISDKRFPESALRLANPLIPNLMKTTMKNFRQYLSDQGAI